MPYFKPCNCLASVRSAKIGDKEILDKAVKSKNGHKISKLFQGDDSGYGNDQSRGDGALIHHLAFHTKDPAQLDRLFRNSGRMRPKWDTVHYSDGDTYGQRHIKDALENVNGQYEVRKLEVGNAGNLDQILTEIEESKDVEKVFDNVKFFGTLKASEFAEIRRKLKKIFKSELNLNDFNSAVARKKKEIAKSTKRPSGYPQVLVNGRQQRDVAEEAKKILESSNTPPTVFLRSGRPCEIIIDEDNRPSVKDVNEDALIRILNNVIDFVAESKTGEKDVNPPRGVAKHLSSSDEWNLPPLRGIIEAPVIRIDGTIIDQRGYDFKSKLYYPPTASLKVPKIIGSPSQTDAKAAATWILEETLSDFPFADDCSKANALALLLTPLIRHIIQGSIPLVLVNANSPRVGKTLFCNLVSVIATGRAGNLFGSCSSDDEWGKTIFAALREGQSLLIFDNINSTIKSASLCRAITSKIFSNRILGVSNTGAYPSNVTWIANGNNLRLSGDLPARCYWVDLLAEDSRPYLRSGFRHDPLLEWAESCRGEILSKLLTMARAWLVAGKPKPKKKITFGGFEEWTATVGGILAYAGVSNFLETLSEKIDEADSEAIELEFFLTVLFETYRKSETETCVFSTSKITDDILKPDFKKLRNSLPETLSEKISHSDYNNTKSQFSRALGLVFRQIRGRRFGDNNLFLENCGKNSNTKIAKWRVKKTITS